MAITLKASPTTKYVTGYNPIVFAVDSDNKNELGFRYVFNIYSGETSQVIAKFEVPPRFGDDYGVQDLSRVLQNYLSYDFATESLGTGGADIRNSWVPFDIGIGESFQAQPWIFTDYQFFSATGTTANGYISLYNTGQTHNYTVGQQINIVQSTFSGDTPYVYPPLDGLHTIIVVPNANEIVVDLVLPLPSPNFGVLVSGSTTFADNSRFEYPDLYTASGYTAFNGVVPANQKRFDSTQYIMTSFGTDKKFLSNIPNGVRKTANEDLYLNFINGGSSVPYYLNIVNSNGETFNALIINGSERLVQIGAGPHNFYSGTTPQSGTLPVVKPDTEWYDIVVRSQFNLQVSETYRINIDRRCAINDISICFMDRLGSFGSFAFQLKYQDNTQVERSTYNKESGFITDATWDYSMVDGGTSIYNVNLTRNLTLNTNWMTEAEARYFDELISSPVTLIKFTADGEYEKCIVTDGGYETAQQRNKNLIRKTVNVAISVNDNINI